MVHAGEFDTGLDCHWIEQGMLSSLTSLRQLLGGSFRVETDALIRSAAAAHSSLANLRAGGVEVALTLSGKLSGTLFLVFTSKAAIWMVSDLVGEQTRTLPFDEMSRSALKEVGNVVASSFLGALERLSGTGGLPGLPVLRESDVAPGEEGAGDRILYGLPIYLIPKRTCSTRAANAGLFILCDTKPG